MAQLYIIKRSSAECTINIINEVYGNISENILSDNILDPDILASKNDYCTWINTDILNQIPGEQRTYHSYDKIICDDDKEIGRASCRERV